MGWTDCPKNRIVNDEFMKWTLAFWMSWVSQESGYERTLYGAIDDANDKYPNVKTKAVLYWWGSPLLRWKD